MPESQPQQINTEIQTGPALVATPQEITSPRASQMSTAEANLGYLLQEAGKQLPTEINREAVILVLALNTNLSLAQAIEQAQKVQGQKPAVQSTPVHTAPKQTKPVLDKSYERLQQTREQSVDFMENQLASVPSDIRNQVAGEIQNAIRAGWITHVTFTDKKGEPLFGNDLVQKWNKIKPVKQAESLAVRARGSLEEAREQLDKGTYQEPETPPRTVREQPVQPAETPISTPETPAPEAQEPASFGIGQLLQEVQALRQEVRDVLELLPRKRKAKPKAAESKPAKRTMSEEARERLRQESKQRKAKVLAAFNNGILNKDDPRLKSKSGKDLAGEPLYRRAFRILQEETIQPSPAPAEAAQAQPPAEAPDATATAAKDAARPPISPEEKAQLQKDYTAYLTSSQPTPEQIAKAIQAYLIIHTDVDEEKARQFVTKQWSNMWGNSLPDTARQESATLDTGEKQVASKNIKGTSDRTLYEIFLNSQTPIVTSSLKDYYRKIHPDQAQSSDSEIEKLLLEERDKAQQSFNTEEVSIPTQAETSSIEPSLSAPSTDKAPTPPSTGLPAAAETAPAEPATPPATQGGRRIERKTGGGALSVKPTEPEPEHQQTPLEKLTNEINDSLGRGENYTMQVTADELKAKLQLFLPQKMLEDVDIQNSNIVIENNTATIRLPINRNGKQIPAELTIKQNPNTGNLETDINLPLGAKLYLKTTGEWANIQREIAKGPNDLLLEQLHALGIDKAIATKIDITDGKFNILIS